MHYTGKAVTEEPFGSDKTNQGTQEPRKPSSRPLGHRSKFSTVRYHVLTPHTTTASISCDAVGHGQKFLRPSLCASMLLPRLHPFLHLTFGSIPFPHTSVTHVILIVILRRILLHSLSKRDIDPSPFAPLAFPLRNAMQPIRLGPAPHQHHISAR